ncbi:hypothetical protein LguiB_035022 [Lonicera macranthoides]
MAPPTRATNCTSEEEEEPLVRFELEAAEALTGLASGEVCPNRAEEMTRRVENEISAGESVPIIMSSDLDQDWGVVTVPQHFGKRCNIITTKSVKAKQDNAQLKSNPTFATTYTSSGGSKSRKNLTEALKLRRVLANRESARQTIRRRQALYEELTRKAADLALENDNLKREKELAEKEYDLLRSTNECLKAQMTKIVKAEEEEIQIESTSTTYVDTSTSPSTSCPIFIYNNPSFLPFLWPPIVQPSDSVQSQYGPQSALSTESFRERVNPTNTSIPQSAVYLVPYPWPFPLPNHHSSGPHLQSSPIKDQQDETSSNNLSTTSSSSRPIVHLQNQHSLRLVNNKTEPSIEAIPANDIHENPFGFQPDGGGLCPRGTGLVPVPLSCVSAASTIEYKRNPRPEPACYVSKASQPAECDIIKGPKKEGDAVTAADARKRRKELKRLKHLHPRY